MFHVYAIYNEKNNKIYIVQTSNLPSRLELHNKKEFKRCYTARFDGKWELVYTESLDTRQEALNRERQLKSYQGRQFVKNLIINSRVAQR